MADIPCRSGRSFWLDGFPLRVLRHDHRRNRGLHRHDFFELVVVTSGKCVHATASEQYEISAGDVFLIRPGAAHSYTAVSDFSLVNILYLPDILPLCDLVNSPGYQALFVLEPEVRPPRGFRRHLRLDRDMLARVVAEAGMLETRLEETKPGHRFRALGVFMDIVGMLSDYFSDVSVPEERSELFRLGRLLGFLEQNYARPLTLPEIARYGSVSEVTLYRLFRKGTGESPVNCLNRIRIRHAEALLLNTALTVAEIAAATGFADSNYFSRYFRKIAGMPPRDFRRNGGKRQGEG